MSSDAAGTPLGSKYFIGPKIGAGATGVVYRGSAAGLDESLAIKLLRTELVEDDTAVTRFLRERTIFKQIDHPNVVRILDLVAEGDRLGIVMEMVEGGDLRQRLAEARPRPSEAMRLGIAIASGLAAIHANGVVHRDLKPANVLLEASPDGPLPKISDFGISAFEDSMITGSPVIMGTPPYMAPEVANRDGAESASDVYALGVMLFELLVGETPFVGETPIEIITAHLLQPPPHIRGVPGALDELMQVMLAKSPAERPTAREVASRLHQLAPRLRRRRRPSAIRTAGSPAVTKQPAAMGMLTGTAAAMPSIPAPIPEPPVAESDQIGEAAEVPARVPVLAGVAADGADGVAPGRRSWTSDGGLDDHLAMASGGVEGDPFVGDVAGVGPEHQSGPVPSDPGSGGDGGQLFTTGEFDAPPSGPIGGDGRVDLSDLPFDDDLLGGGVQGPGPLGDGLDNTDAPGEGADDPDPLSEGANEPGPLGEGVHDSSLLGGGLDNADGLDNTGPLGEGADDPDPLDHRAAEERPLAAPSILAAATAVRLPPPASDVTRSTVAGAGGAATAADIGRPLPPTPSTTTGQGGGTSIADMPTILGPSRAPFRPRPGKAAERSARKGRPSWIMYCGLGIAAAMAVFALVTLLASNENLPTGADSATEDGDEEAAAPGMADDEAEETTGQDGGDQATTAPSTTVPPAREDLTEPPTTRRIDDASDKASSTTLNASTTQDPTTTASTSPTTRPTTTATTTPTSRQTTQPPTTRPTTTQRQTTTATTTPTSRRTTQPPTTRPTTTAPPTTRPTTTRPPTTQAPTTRPPTTQAPTTRPPTTRPPTTVPPTTRPPTTVPPTTRPPTTQPPTTRPPTTVPPTTQPPTTPPPTTVPTTTPPTTPPPTTTPPTTTPPTTPPPTTTPPTTTPPTTPPPTTTPPTTTPPTTSPPTTVPPADRYLVGFAGKCLDVQGPSTNNGTPVQIWDCVAGASQQQWHINGDGEVRVFGDKCLDVRGPSSANGTVVQIWDCVGEASQQTWSMSSTGQLRVFGNKCLDVRGPSANNGTAVQIWDCVGNVSQQRWRFDSDPFGDPIIGFGDKCLDVQGPSTNNGTPVQLWECIPGAPQQRWHLLSNGEIRGYGDKCLDVRGPSTNNGTVVQIYSCVGNVAQQTWDLTPEGELRVFGDKCLDVRGPSTANGTPIQIWDCVGGAPQQTWRIG